MYISNNYSNMNVPINISNNNDFINNCSLNSCCCPSCGEPAGKNFNGSGEDYESFICLKCGKINQFQIIINVKFVMEFFVVNAHSIIINSEIMF